jgi:outer membrane lipoprotein-sorting protein
VVVLAADAAQAQGSAAARLDGLEGGDKLKALIEAVVAQQRSVRSLRAEFTQRKASALLLEPVESTGEFAFRAPDTVRWDYAAPESMVVLLAENRLTTFFPERQRAEAVKLSSRHRRFVAVLAGTQPLDDLAESFRMTLADAGGDAPYRLTLVPSQAVIRKKLTSVVLEVDRTLLLPVMVEYNEADGDSTRYEFRRLEVNPTLDDSLFRLDLGGDVRVEEIDASSGLG